MSGAVTHELLVESARWRLLGLLFERPRPGWHEELRALAAEVDDERLTAAAAEAADVGEGDYLAVMGHGGGVSPREVGYRPLGDPGKILAELAGVYEAFGYQPRAEDPADHVAVEAGFVGYMKLKQAFALAREDPDAERTVADAVAVFLEDHLGPLARELERCTQRRGLPHLQRAASLLRERCPRTTSTGLAVVRGTATGPDDVDEPFDCSDCPA